MKESLKILMVEDNPNDARLIAIELGRNYELTIHRVETEENFIKELNSFNPDIILSDYTLPNFDGMRALNLAQHINTLVPFILITGSINEETAVAVMKAGADDYIIKENLHRLNTSVDSAIQKKKALKEKLYAEIALKEAEERFRGIFENTVIGIYRTSVDGKILLANPALIKMLGYNSFEELALRNLEKNGFDINYPRESFKTQMEKSGEFIGIQSAWKKADGTLIYVRESARAIKNENGETLYYEGVVEDVTQQRIAEAELQKAESKYKILFMNSNDAIFIMDGDSFIECNPKAGTMFRCSPEDLITRKPWEISPKYQSDGEESIKKSETILSAAMSGIPQCFEWQHKRCDGTIFETEISLNLFEIDNKKLLQAMVRDISDRKRAEQELIKSESMFRSVWENSFDGMRLVNENGINVLVNKAFCNIVGLTQEELIGKPLSIIYSEDEKERVQNKFLERVKDDIIDPFFEREIILHNGKKLWLEISNSFVVKGESKLILSIIRDVTLRKNSELELRDSEARFRNIFNSANEGICVSDESENITSANQKFLDMLGYSLEELVGKNFIELVFREDLQDYSFRQATRKNYKRETYERRLVKKDGSVIWCFVSASPITNNNDYKGSFGMFIDITENKRMIQELIAAKDKAEEMSRLKSNFLANMSHELRTPLIGILGYAEIIKDESTDAEAASMAKVIFNSGNRLLETVNLILDLSRVEAGKLEIKKQVVDVVSSIDEVIESFQAAAKLKNLYLKKTCSYKEILFKSDKMILKQIINNLVNNAIKFTFNGGVNIDLSKIENNQQEMIVIKVTDTGIGIPEEKQKLIWEEFRQVSEGISRNFEGSGLGLTITKRFVEKLGGTISVYSQSGAGSTFTLNFPVEKIKSDELGYNNVNINGENLSTPEHGHLKKSLLIVEDDDMSILLFKKYLKDFYNLDIAKDGQTAIDKAKVKIYDGILMDINLTRGFSGVDTTKKIRQIAGYENIPIAAVTAYAMVGDKEEFLAAGCSHYISKPFTKKIFMDFITKMMQE